jgi:DNA helicase-2/ATP-dependent DNA helicase PcrA
MPAAPGPLALGRGVVIRAGRDTPGPWASADRVLIDDAILSDPDRLTELIDRLHRAWVARAPLVIEWHLDDDALAPLEISDLPPWDVEPTFLFPLERLRFLVFTNNYDARAGDPKWWWTVKAARAGIEDGDEADGLTRDGEPVWIDGGPRQALDALDHPVVHGETVDLGATTPVPPPRGPVSPALAPDQLEAVGHAVGPARIIAPAGSGKTRTLVARLRHLLDDRDWPEAHTMVLAYNRRAADELVERLGIGRRMVRTIHALGWEILKEARPGLELIGEGDVRNHMNALIQIPRRANADPVGPYLEALDSVRIGLRDPEVVEAERDDVAGFADAFDRVRDRMYQRAGVDHGEQIYGAIEALLRDPQLRARWQSRCRHLLVDEFQDLTPAYLLLIRLVASPQLDVFGVGDDDQVIYGYAGADPEYLIDFDALFPGAGHHALAVNYRCPPDVVEAAATLLGYNTRRIAKDIRAGAPPRSEPGLRVVTGDVAVAGTAASQVAELLAEGVAPTAIAVLTRVNAGLIPIKAALREQGIATNDLLNADSLNRTTVRALFAWLRLGREPERMGRADLIEAARRPSRGLAGVARELLTRRHFDLGDLVDLGERLDGRQSDRWNDFISDLEHMADAASTADAGTAIDVLLDQIGLTSSAHTLDSSRSNASRSGHVDDLVAVRRAAALHPDLSTFPAWLAGHTGARSSAAGVTLSSIHRVKGMEWPHVIVFGADRGAMPHDLADEPEEERRVFHVAITRAIERVTVYADAARPSRYLKELDGTAQPEKPASPTVSRRRREPSMAPAVGDLVTLRGGIRGTVAAIDATAVEVMLEGGVTMDTKVRDIIAMVRPTEAGFDQAIFEALRAWRREVSSRQGVPAYVILHDRTMEEIAARKPTTEAELATIAGIGPAKLDNYGDDILAVVEAAG